MYVCGVPGELPQRSVPADLPTRSDSTAADCPPGGSRDLHGLSQVHRPLPRRRVDDGRSVMRDTDVLVIGAGPAGCMAAWEAKRCAPELDVVLLERDRAVGAPVRCAEGVGDAGLREFAEPDGAPWVARKITRVIFLAPDDTEVKVAERDVGWILDRTRFDAFLGDRAAAAGVTVLVGTEAAGMSRDTGGGWRVQLRGAGGEELWRARIVIGADGVEAMVGRWAGLDTRVPARDMESCAQYVLRGIDIDPDAIYLQFGRAIAPGGYAWVFPRAPGIANVGLGIVALKADGRNAREYRDDHLKYYRIKQALEELDDDFFNSLARTVNAIPGDKRTLGRIFAHALVRHPQLIPVAAKFFL